MATETHAALERFHMDLYRSPLFVNPFGQKRKAGPQLVFWQPEKGKLPVYIGEQHFDGKAVEVKHWGEVVHVDREIARYVG